MRAWIDLCRRKSEGEHVNSADIKKHKEENFMRKNRMIHTLALLICILGICITSQTVQAEDYSYMENVYTSIVNEPYMKNGKAVIEWRKCLSYVDETKEKLAYEVEVSADESFTNAKQYVSDTESLVLDKSEFGKHGGRFYVRVRGVLQLLDQTNSYYGQWSETKEATFVAIDKTNFPGMYKVMKNGGTRINIITGAVEKIIYDENGDGWLDPVEVKQVFSINTTDVSKKVNGKYKLTKATSISSFKGVEYFDNLNSVNVARFSGKKADFSKSSVDTVWIRGVSAKQITVVAPNARTVHVEAAEDNKMTKMDLSKCDSAVEIDAYGNKGTKTLKLPKNKKALKILSVSGIGVTSLDVNTYTKLQQLYIYNCDVKSVKVNKCKNLRYIYFYYCDRIKSLNLKSNTKLRGTDFYKTPGLTKSTVKRPKNGKYTWNEGKWWYETSAYKKDMKKIYQ